MCTRDNAWSKGYKKIHILLVIIESIHQHGIHFKWQFWKTIHQFKAWILLFREPIWCSLFVLFCMWTWKSASFHMCAINKPYRASCMVTAYENNICRFFLLFHMWKIPFLIRNLLNVKRNKATGCLSFYPTSLCLSYSTPYNNKMLPFECTTSLQQQTRKL